MLSPNYDVALNSGWGSVLYVSIFIILTIAIVFRLESMLLPPDRAENGRQSRPGTDENGQPILKDPDGRPF
jgi:hypothetical protein